MKEIQIIFKFLLLYSIKIKSQALKNKNYLKK